MTQLLKGWEQIAALTPYSPRTSSTWRARLLREGVIFYRVTGRPPVKTVFAYSDDLKRVFVS